MAQAKLTLDVDFTPLSEAFIEAQKLIDHTSVETRSFTNSTRKYFQESSSLINEFDSKLIKGAKSLKELDIASTAVPRASLRIKELSDKIKEMAARAEEMRKGGDIVGADAATKKADTYKKELLEIQDVIKNLSQAKINIDNSQVDYTSEKIQNLSNQSNKVDENKIVIQTTVADYEKTVDKLKKLQEESKKNIPNQETNQGFQAFSNNQGANKQVTSLKSLNQELKKYVEAANAAESGTKEWSDAIEKATETKEKIIELQKLMQSIEGNEIKKLTKAFVSVTQTGIQGFEGVIAIENLFGEKNEEVEKQLLKLQSLVALSNVIGEFAELNEKVKQFKIAFSPITSLYVKGNNAIKDFIKNGIDGNKNLGDSNKSLFAGMAEGIVNFGKKGISSIKSLWAVIAANPLGIILTLIGGLVVVMITLKDKIKPIGDLFDFLGKVIEAILSPLERLGQMFGLLSTEREKSLKKFLENTKEEMDQIKNLYDYEISKAQSRNQNVEKLEKQKTEDLKKALSERLYALEELERKNGKLNDEQIKQQKEFTQEYEKILEESSIRQLNLQKQKKQFEEDILWKSVEAKLAIEKNDQVREKALIKMRYEKEEQDLVKQIKLLYETEAEQSEKGFELIRDLRKKRDRELEVLAYQNYIKRLNESRQLVQLQKDFSDAVNDINNKINQNQIVTADQKIQHETLASIKELNILKDSLVKKGQAQEDYQASLEKRKVKTFKLTSIQDEQFNILEQQIYDAQTQKLIHLQVERENKVAQQNADFRKKSIENLQLEEQDKINSIELIQPPKGIGEGIAERTEKEKEAVLRFEKSKQDAILKIQQEYAMKKLELQKNLFAAERELQIKELNGQLALIDGRNDAEAQSQREQIRKTLDLLEEKYYLEGQKIQRETEKIINDLQDQRDKLNRQEQKGQFDLAKFLGISKNDLQNLQTSINEIANFASTLIQTQIGEIDQKIASSEKLKQTYDSDIQSLEAKLASEQQLANEGLANNSSAIQQQIAEKERQKNEEEKIQKDALEQKKKLQKEQLIIDSIVQASNLVTASSQILATTARDPISLGIALTAIAAMIAGFIATRVQAAQAANSVGSNFKDGVIDLQGEGTETSDSIPSNLSKGESVMTAKETRENKNLFLGIRNNNKELIEKGVLDLLKNTGVSLPDTISMSQKRDELKQSEYKLSVFNDYSDLHNEMKKNTQAINDLKSEFGRQTIVDQKGNTIHKVGNNITVVKKNV